MKPIHLPLFALLLTIFSCRPKKTITYSDLIIGEWKIVYEQPQMQVGNDSVSFFCSPTLEEMKSGYSFFSNGVCENKLGYFKNGEIDEFDGHRTYFLGTTTKYKIENDSLKIYNLSDSIWTSKKIVSITSDTMTLQYDDSTFVRYAKVNYSTNSNLSYDQIIISSSGCYGTCPINNISISKTGEIVYFGVKYNTINGCYSARIDSIKLAEITSRLIKLG